VPASARLRAALVRRTLLHVKATVRCFGSFLAQIVCELLEMRCSTRTERAWSNVGVVRTSDLGGRRPHFLHNVLLADRSFSGRVRCCYDMECEVPTGRACWAVE
jgi:hypothetical protein